MKFIRSQNPIFDQMVDDLRGKSEAELKLLYLRFFKDDLADEWKEITKVADFKKASEANIVKAIQKNRYRR